jgi:paraquat-inducible protein B
MSKQASTTVIGAFVVGAIALVVLGVVVFGTGKFFSKPQTYVMFFEGSVKGLNVGASVDFKGVKVGSVTNVKVIFNEEDLSLQIPVYVELLTDRVTQVYGEDGRRTIPADSHRGEIVRMLVERGLRAQLKLQSLVTGQLYVDLDFYPDRPARFRGIEHRHPEIPTIPSNLEQLTKTFEKLPLDEIANKLVASIQGIESFVNSPDLKEAVGSLNQTVKDVQVLLHHIDEQIKPLAASADKALGDARKLIRDVNEKVKPIGSGLEETIKETRDLVQNLNNSTTSVMSSVDQTLKAAAGAAGQAQRTLASLETMTGDDSELRYELSRTLKELSAAARSLRVLADYLERHPDAVIRGK